MKDKKEFVKVVLVACIFGILVSYIRDAKQDLPKRNVTGKKTLKESTEWQRRTDSVRIGYSQNRMQALQRWKGYTSGNLFWAGEYRNHQFKFF